MGVALSTYTGGRDNPPDEMVTVPYTEPLSTTEMATLNSAVEPLMLAERIVVVVDSDTPR
jgi:hypothetical protein